MGTKIQEYEMSCDGLLADLLSLNTAASSG